MAPKQQAPGIILPVSVVGPVDVGRLLRELEAIDNLLMQMKLREAGQEVKMPKTSQIMDQVVAANKLNMLQDADRKRLQSFLLLVKKQAPVLHVSFSADPSPAFVEKLMLWLRTNVHAQVLLTVGLQPGIGAGCVVRTTNKYFDFSLGKRLGAQRELLMKKLREATAVPVQVPAPTVAIAPIAPANTVGVSR